MDSRHRPVMLFGMSFFALFTMVCALAPTFIGLVIARAFQGMNMFTLDRFEPWPHSPFFNKVLVTLGSPRISWIWWNS